MRPPPLTRTTIALHWIVASSIIALWGFGFWMARTQSYEVFHVHKSLGLIALTVIAWRAVRRVARGLPTPAARYEAREHQLAVIAHWTLLALTVALPLFGMLSSGGSGHGFGVFELTLLPGSYAEDGSVVPLSPLWQSVGYWAHRLTAYALACVLVLHVAGALKHHLVDRDATLRRMLGWRSEGASS